MYRPTRYDLFRLATLHVALLLPSVSTAQSPIPGPGCYVAPTSGQTACYSPVSPAASFIPPQYYSATPVTAYYPVVQSIPVQQPVAVYANPPGPVEGFFRDLFQNPRPGPQLVATPAPQFLVVPTPVVSASSIAPATAYRPTVTAGAQPGYSWTKTYQPTVVTAYPQNYASIPYVHQQPTVWRSGTYATPPPVPAPYNNGYGSQRTPSSSPNDGTSSSESVESAPPGTAPSPPKRFRMQYDDQRDELPDTEVSWRVYPSDI